MKKLFVPFAVLAATLATSFAQTETGLHEQVVTAIEAQETGIKAIGGAGLAIGVVFIGYKLIRRAMTRLS